MVCFSVVHLEGRIIPLRYKSNYFISHPSDCEEIGQSRVFSALGYIICIYVDPAQFSHTWVTGSLYLHIGDLPWRFWKKGWVLSWLFLTLWSFLGPIPLIRVCSGKIKPILKGLPNYFILLEIWFHCWDLRIIGLSEISLLKYAIKLFILTRLNLH